MKPDEKFDLPRFRNWSFDIVPSDPTGWIRFYYREFGNSFEFETIHLIRHDSASEPFGGEDSIIEKSFYGTACFDGIRHFYMDYYHYADLRVVEWVINRLKQLEEKNCPESDRVLAMRKP